MSEISGMNVQELVSQFGTPLFVYDESALRQKLHDFTTCFQSQTFATRVVYASKAFNCKAMIDLIKECSTSDGLVIRIGSENKIEGLNECSVVTATYSVNGVKLGTIGVLGPTRMDYPRVVAALEYVRKRLTGGNNLEAPEGMAMLPGGGSAEITEVK